VKPKRAKVADWLSTLAAAAGIGVDEWPDLTLLDWSRRVQRKLWN
jgi:hypothetical protein